MRTFLFALIIATGSIYASDTFPSNPNTSDYLPAENTQPSTWHGYGKLGVFHTSGFARPQFFPTGGIGVRQYKVRYGLDFSLDFVNLDVNMGYFGRTRMSHPVLNGVYLHYIKSGPFYLGAGAGYIPHFSQGYEATVSLKQVFGYEKRTKDSILYFAQIELLESGAWLLFPIPSLSVGVGF